MNELSTAREIMRVLGGTKSVAELTARKATAVKNWRVFGHFPSDTYHVMRCELEKLGYSAPPSLWRQVECKE